MHAMLQMEVHNNSVGSTLNTSTNSSTLNPYGPADMWL
jgi:hypothetical protein